jgi:putative transposase
MGQPIAVRRDFTAIELRRLARRAKDSDQVRRLLAIAAVLDGASRAEAAKVGVMDRQTLRDWVIRFNEQGPDGLINIPAPGAPAKLNKGHRAFLARIVDEGPIPAIHGVVRWRGCDLIMRLHEEFGISVSDDTVYRALKDLGFSHVSARPRAYKQDGEAIEARPVASGLFECAMIGLLQRIRPRTKPGQDGDTRVPVLINFAASTAIF